MKYWNEEKKELQDTPVVVEPVEKVAETGKETDKPVDEVAEDPKKAATKKK